MWWADFDNWMIATHGKTNSFYTKIYPQIKAIVVHTLLAARNMMENAEFVSYSSFHLFGFDLMVSAEPDFQVSLIEVNSSPAVAADLMPNMTEDLVHCAIDPIAPILDSDILQNSSNGNIGIAIKAARAAAKYLTVDQTIALRNKSDEIVEAWPQHSETKENIDGLTDKNDEIVEALPQHSETKENIEGLEDVFNTIDDDDLLRKEIETAEMKQSSGMSRSGVYVFNFEILIFFIENFVPNEFL
eukprot:GSMAST32.ASY1.ANO1.1691.1 assembled CDS